MWGYFQKESSIFKKMLFTETSKSKARYIHSLFFVFATGVAFLINLAPTKSKECHFQDTWFL